MRSNNKRRDVVFKIRPVKVWIGSFFIQRFSCSIKRVTYCYDKLYRILVKYTVTLIGERYCNRIICKAGSTTVVYQNSLGPTQIGSWHFVRISHENILIVECFEAAWLHCRIMFSIWFQWRLGWAATLTIPRVQHESMPYVLTNQINNKVLTALNNMLCYYVQ